MIRSRLWIVLVCAVGIVGSAACSDSGFKLVPPSGNPQQNVMVIDTGIDLTAADLQGRVSAVYTETCADDSGGPASDAGSMPAVDGGPAFDAMKQQLLMELAQPDDSCDLKPGISGKTDPMPTIAKFKARWNAMVRANQVPSQAFTADEIGQLMMPIDNEMETFAYHGTATSTTVSHENPAARLVLVERELASESSLMAGFDCFVQSDIDQAVDLLSDPQVYAASVAQPAQIDTQIAQAQTTYKVGIVNESFGAQARQTLETEQQTAKCPPIDLSAYFALIDKMTNAHNATIAGPSILTVQAAGNDGVEIDTGADSLSCDLGDPKDLLVGSYDPATLARNTFSNYGACVNVYAPGQDIVVEYAGGWLLFPDGTSFASPLTARYASMDTGVPSPFDPAGARTAVLSVIGQQNQFLPVNLFPQDFFYTPAQTTTDFVVPLAASRVAHQAPPHRPPPHLLTQHELHRVLGPLNRVRRLLHGR